MGVVAIKLSHAWWCFVWAERFFLLYFGGSSRRKAWFYFDLKI